MHFRKKQRLDTDARSTIDDCSFVNNSFYSTEDDFGVIASVYCSPRRDMETSIYKEDKQPQSIFRRLVQGISGIVTGKKRKYSSDESTEPEEVENDLVHTSTWNKNTPLNRRLGIDTGASPLFTLDFAPAPLTPSTRSVTISSTFQIGTASTSSKQSVVTPGYTTGSTTRPVRRLSRPNSALNSSRALYSYSSTNSLNFSNLGFIRENEEESFSNNYRRETNSFPRTSNETKTKIYSVDKNAAYTHCFGQHIRFMSHETLNALAKDTTPEKKKRPPSNQSYYHDIPRQSPCPKKPVSIMMGVMQENGPPTIFEGRERVAL